LSVELEDDVPDCADVALAVELADAFGEEPAAALAIAPPPPTRTPESTIAPMAFFICMCISLTSFLSSEASNRFRLSGCGGVAVNRLWFIPPKEQGRGTGYEELHPEA
jgi:hypothetical protein